MSQSNQSEDMNNINNMNNFGTQIQNELYNKIQKYLITQDLTSNKLVEMVNKFISDNFSNDFTYDELQNLPTYINNYFANYEIDDKFILNSMFKNIIKNMITQKQSNEAFKSFSLFIKDAEKSLTSFIANNVYKYLKQVKMNLNKNHTDKNQQETINKLVDRVSKLENIIIEMNNEIKELKTMKKQLDDITNILNDDNDNDDNDDEKNINYDEMPPLIKDDMNVIDDMDDTKNDTKNDKEKEQTPEMPDFSKMLNQFEVFGKSMAIEFIKSFNLSDISKKNQ